MGPGSCYITDPSTQTRKNLLHPARSSDHCSRAQPQARALIPGTSVSNGVSYEAPDRLLAARHPEPGPVPSADSSTAERLPCKSWCNQAGRPQVSGVWDADQAAPAVAPDTRSQEAAACPAGRRDTSVTQHISANVPLRCLRRSCISCRTTSMTLSDSVISADQNPD
jgi:hypothetical protein